MSSLASQPTSTASFAPAYAPNDQTMVDGFLRDLRFDDKAQSNIDATATSLIEGIRGRAGRIGGLEDFLRDYGLSTREGLALMVMAEALLRVPDAATQDRLIEDKIGTGDWAHHIGKLGTPNFAKEDQSKDETWFVSAATWGLGLSGRIVKPGDNPQSILSAATKRIGAPAVRLGVRQAMRFLGHQFVLGQTIGRALDRARSSEKKGARHSYDMLGEGARTWADAEQYRQSYADAIEAIGKSAQGGALPARPGISVKLSALHPRYEARNRANVLAQLVSLVVELARAARAHKLNFTVDAEEQNRLELSIDVVDAVMAELAASGDLNGWDGFGIAIQAYGKRAMPVIDHMAALGDQHGARLMVRLVKGAYWDSEIKHSHVEGAADFPVFSRKPATDLSFLACAQRLLARRDVFYPQIATHNALTVASVMELAAQTGDARSGFEFQRLHGMGEELYEQLHDDQARDGKTVACRIYAPVGGHRDLLAYLVRRLLENGANSSFVAKVGDPKVPVAELLERPSHILRNSPARHGAITMPKALFDGRPNSHGVEFGSRKELGALTRAMAETIVPAAPKAMTGQDVDKACDRAAKAFPAWRDAPADHRAQCLEKAADLLEQRTPGLCAILAQEANKTIDDGIAEVREAVDFLRFYATEARRLCGRFPLPGPAGERNEYITHGRGVFAAIAPWNFPLAIFLGQVSAGLAAGNAVMAKPAPQTPTIGAEALTILHQAGVPEDVVILVPGGVEAGQALVANKHLAGVAFTGSTATATAINLALAQKDGPIVPLIAETGGANAMIADATALPEQVTDDVILSAFRSAGQRCSACRILYVQEDVADRLITMIEGAAACLQTGDPMDTATDIGPVIDSDAAARLNAYIDSRQSQIRWQGARSDDPNYVPPTIIELGADEALTEEVFGPILHIKRYKAGTLNAVVDEINASGFGLTFALHSRIDSVIGQVSKRVDAGNLYINRNQIGAIVGSQPFGGRGKSGTGPKAGGPLYLSRFLQEQVISTDTTAAGGNASLIALEDEA
jgi:RHH-type proline utilization regulon transcriptional repressor/proline dehydrogenase/delta 1-pyrroline-5-carboxylate dehydrogenase